MTAWALIKEDNTIEYYSELPLSWKNVSNLPALPANILSGWGWYPITSIAAPTFNPYKERLIRVLTKVGSIVEETWSLQPLSADIIQKNIDTQRELAVQRINDEAGKARCKYITNLPGQDSTYEMKKEEATRYVGATNPQDIDFPMLSAEALACNMSISALAQSVLTAANTWKQKAAAIEGQRRGALKKIKDATTVEAIEAATQITWA